jgi:hypothetical protein
MDSRFEWYSGRFVAGFATRKLLRWNCGTMRLLEHISIRNGRPGLLRSTSAGKLKSRPDDHPPNQVHSIANIIQDCQAKLPGCTYALGVSCRLDTV